MDPYQKEVPLYLYAGRIIKPDKKGAIIATWVANRGDLFAYITLNNENIPVAITDPDFDPRRSTIRPLVCFVNTQPNEPIDLIEIRQSGSSYAKGIIVYFE